MRWGSAILTQRLLAALVLAAPAPGRAEAPAELLPLAAPIGLARLVMPEGAAAPPLVIMLPDALGEDGRAEHYVGSLAARGVASLVLGLGEDLDTNPAPVDPAASPEALAVALGWARAAGFLPSQIGVLGFGLGGRAALAAEEKVPVAALYPGCSGIRLRRDGPALVLQGAQRARDCEALPQREGVEIRLLQGAGHGWDAPGALWPSLGSVMPDPAGNGTLRAHADVDVTLLAAEVVADWFEGWLLAGYRRANR
jgi:dienelactone hydrolase